MLRPLSFFLIVTLVGVVSPEVFAQGESKAVQLPAKENFKIILLLGQSNMAGRGFVEEEDRVPIPRVYMLDKNNEWVSAVEPVHFDKPTAGVGPGREFARRLVESDPTVSVGLVPAACGGSSISDWKPGVFFKQTNSHPYDDAISRARRAMEDGILEAVLWRQGEADVSPNRAEKYESLFEEFVKRLRRDLNNVEAPFLVGELKIVKGNMDGAERVKQAQLNVVKRNQPAGFVSADDVTLNPDNVHFDRKSQLEQGRRFFEVYSTLKSTGE